MENKSKSCIITITSKVNKALRELTRTANTHYFQQCPGHHQPTKHQEKVEECRNMIGQIGLENWCKEDLEYG
jgi:hypothetical protein